MNAPLLMSHCRHLRHFLYTCHLISVAAMLLIANTFVLGQNPALEVEGNGFLPPRMTTMERDAISFPEKGLMIFNLTTDCIEIFRGSGWYSLCNGGTFITGPLNSLAGGREDDFAQSIRQTPDGGFIVAGSGVSPMGDVDFFVVKLDISGSMLWSKHLGGSGIDSACSIDLTKDGGFVVAGFSNSSSDQDVSEVNKGGFDFWVVKLDANGNKIWDRLLGGSADDKARSVIQDADGSFIVAGLSLSSNSGDVTGTNHGLGDFWVVKIDRDGLVVWSHLYGGDRREEAFNLIQTCEGGYAIVGYSLTIWPIGGMGTSPYGSNFFVVKINTSGILDWQTPIGTQANDYAQRIWQTSDASFIIAGYHDDATEPAIAPLLGYSGFLAKLNSKGQEDVNWSVELDGDGDELIYDLLQTSDGNFITIGSSTSSNTGDITASNHGQEDIWIIKLNPLGEVIWCRLLGADQKDVATSVCQTSDGGYIVSGFTNSTSDGDVSSTNNGGFDYWVIKLDAFGNLEK